MNIMRFMPIVFLLLFGSTAVKADDFPPVTDAERQLTEVAGQPGAPAVVLFKKAELKFRDFVTEASSSLEVQVRFKILTEEGKDYSEVEIPHSGYYRLRRIKGRTILPDGRIVELPEDAVFEERRSRSLKIFVTKLVFPAVEVGAIIDYRYSANWDSLAFLEPWYFQSQVPTLLSEITYIKPDRLAMKPWSASPPQNPIQAESKQTVRGLAIRAWGENLPGLPEEPYAPPFEAMSSRFMMIPTRIAASGQQRALLETWESACELYIDFYKDARRKDRKAKKRATEIAAGATSLLDKIAAIHAFVRDEIDTILVAGVDIPEDSKVDDVLADGRGWPMEKALTLQSMLDAIKVDSELIWTADRSTGMIDLTVPNPWWFDTALVRIEVDGRQIYLDPVDRSVGFGRIAPHYEGTKGLRFDDNKPEIVDLPTSPSAGNSRRANIALKIEEGGRVTGEGTMELEGHRAWSFLRWKDDPEATREAWEERLSDQFAGYEVTDVEVEEKIDDQYVRVGWSIRQRDEDMLGDEVTLSPSLPVGPATQLFSLPPELRRTPVQLLYGRSDELVTTVSWPESWALDVIPEGVDLAGPAGQLLVRVKPDEAAGKITFQRLFEVTQRDFVNAQGYGALRDLYEEAARVDAQDLVLVSD